MPTIDELISERDALIKEHPELQKYQAEIDDILSKTPPEKRVEVLAILIAAKTVELSKEYSKLQQIVIGVAKDVTS